MREYQRVIYQNIVRGMQVLVDAREKLDIAWDNPATEIAAERARKFLHGTELDAEYFEEYAPTVQILWQDRAIRKAYDRRREFQIVSAHPHHSNSKYVERKQSLMKIFRKRILLLF